MNLTIWKHWHIAENTRTCDVAEGCWSNRREASQLLIPASIQLEESAEEENDSVQVGFRRGTAVNNMCRRRCAGALQEGAQCHKLWWLLNSTSQAKPCTAVLQFPILSHKTSTSSPPSDAIWACRYRTPTPRHKYNIGINKNMCWARQYPQEKVLAAQKKCYRLCVVERPKVREMGITQPHQTVLLFCYAECAAKSSILLQTGQRLRATETKMRWAGTPLHGYWRKTFAYTLRQCPRKNSSMGCECGKKKINDRL